MSIYEKESYSTSKCVFLAGPIEWWWGTEEEPDRWNSPAAIEYRRLRDMLSDALVDAGYLVYRPDRAFKGNWNEKMQGVNDFVLLKSDIVIDMTPDGVEALGTKHEVSTAYRAGIPILRVPIHLGSDTISKPENWLNEVISKIVQILE